MRFKKLRAEMYGNDYTQAYIAEVLNRSQGYVSTRFSGKKAFDLDDVYAICKLLSIPHDQISLYFPPEGKTNGKEVKASA